MSQALNALSIALTQAGVTGTQAAPAAPVAPAAPAAPTFDADAVKAAAVALSSADKSFESAMLSTATELARILTTSPTLALWDGVKAAFCADYMAARGCTDKTADNRWSNVAARMESEFSLEKPKAVTPAAVKKSEQRETQAAKVDKAIQQHGTVQAMLEAAKKASGADVPVLAQAIAKASLAEQKASAEKVRETLKTERETVRDRCGKCTDAATLTLAAQVFLMDADMVAAVSAELAMIAKRVDAARAKARKAADAKVAAALAAAPAATV